MIPTIHGLTVCVDYAEYLAFSLPRWLPGLASLTVVTTRADHDTEAVCFHFGRQFPTPLRLWQTDALTLHGAAFNKGLAMEEARLHMPWQEWILFFDADVVPEPTWMELLDPLQLGYLYGCKRRACAHYTLIDDPRCPFEPDDRLGYGYFQLFHSRDPKVQHTPLLDTHWRHAGNYDSNFLLRFGTMTQGLPLQLWHLGHRGQWFGKHQPGAFEAMQQRRQGQGIHDSEKLP